MTIQTKFNMNDVLRDTTSGFTGQVLGITRYSTGCTHYGLAPKTLKPDGTIHTWEWFDESRLEVVALSDKSVPAIPTSGPDMNPAMK